MEGGLIFIVNPLSGGKDKHLLAAMIRNLCPDARLVYTERPGHGEQLARSCPEKTVVAVGGDGTVSEIARGIIGTDKVLGIIPRGSGDGLALHLGLSRIPLVALEELLHGDVEEMDYALINGRPFFCTAGMGLDAEVAWKFASGGKKRGLKRYISLAWKLWGKYTPDDYSITVDGEEHNLKAVIVTVGNANQWGNEARITSLASVQDGLLDIVAVKPFKSLDIPLLAAKLMDGRAHTSKKVVCFRGSDILIRRPGEGPAHYDGDPLWLGPEIHFQAVPSGLRVLVPKGRKI